jgi:hypothetical protein
MKQIMPILERGNGLELTRVRLLTSRLRGGDALGLDKGSRRFPSVHSLEKEEYAMRRSGLLVVFVTFGLTVLGALGVAHALTTISFDLVPVNAACLSHATGDVTVLHKEDTLGVDTLHLDVSGLPANTDFAVFLTSADAFVTPPFGTAAYIGDFTTNAAGIGSLKVDAIIAEAFVSTLVGTPPNRVRADLDHLVFWFADPDQVPGCFKFSGFTPFDGDGHAGPAAMSSQRATGLEDFSE